jgi:hypothetical protein
MVVTFWSSRALLCGCTRGPPSGYRSDIAAVGVVAKHAFELLAQILLAAIVSVLSRQIAEHLLDDVPDNLSAGLCLHGVTAMS